MSFNTFLGALAGFGLFFGAVMLATDNVAVFLSGASIILVLGGTLAATFISYEARSVMQGLTAITSAFRLHRVGQGGLNGEVGRVIRWAYLVQKEGMLALDAEAKKTPGWDGGFLRFGVELILTGYGGEEVRRILANTIETTFERNMVRAAILRSMAATAPAFGMIGTLVGLVIMLETLGGDPKGMGPALAIALLTTLYGVLLSRMIFLPASSKLAQKEGILRFRNFLITEGFAMLADHKSPRYIQDKMNSYLDPSIHYKIDRQGGGGGRQQRGGADAAAAE